jgi:hypothetical protein
MDKAEIIFDISPQHMTWSGGRAIGFVTGAPAGLKGNIIARRESRFAKGGQVNGTPNRLHQDQPAFGAGMPSTADDFQAPTDADRGPESGPAAGTPNALGTGANTKKVPNQKPAVTAVESFREILRERSLPCGLPPPMPVMMW